MSESQIPSGSPLEPSDDRPRTPWVVHLICYLLLSGLLVYVLIGRYVRPLVLRNGIGVESGQSSTITPDERIHQVDSRIDPNTASWVELDAFLPGVGEVTAKRIVAYRQAHRKSGTHDDSSPSVVFLRPEDLQAVPGIGPKTMTRIAPHLVFPGSPADQPAD